MTPYTGYPDVQGIIYQDELNRNWLMHTDELYKFSDARLNYKAQRLKVDAQLGEVCRRKTNIRVISFTMKMEILLEPTSNKLMVGDLCDSIRIKLVTTGKKRWCNSIRIKLVLERFYTSAGNPVKEILLKLNLPDHRILKDGGEDFRYSDTERLSRSDEVLKVKNFKKDATLKLSKSTNQEWYEHVGPDVTRSQDEEVTRWQNEIMLG
ncbi:hypothetical protein Tco_0881981 [Tanacetum coccineum]